MKRLHQEVVRVVLLDGQLHCITKVDISNGTVNQSLASTTPSEADRELTRRIAAAAKILQIKFLDHFIVGQGYFSFQEAGLL